MTEALLLLVVAGTVAGLWSWSTAGRERVIGEANRLCKELGLQKLDDNIALRVVTVRRHWGALRFVRIYRFEFTTDGRERRTGDIALLGNAPWWAVVHLADGPVHLDLGPGARVLEFIPRQ